MDIFSQPIVVSEIRAKQRDVFAMAMAAYKGVKEQNAATVKQLIQTLLPILYWYVLRVTNRATAYKR